MNQGLTVFQNRDVFKHTARRKKAVGKPRMRWRAQQRIQRGLNGENGFTRLRREREI